MSDSSHNSSYYERLLEAELAKVEFDSDQDDFDPTGDRERADRGSEDPFNQSMQSFRSALSNDTVITQGQKEIQNLIKKKLTDDDDIDAHIEQLLEMQRKKNVKLMKNFEENNENFKELRQMNQREMEKLE